MTAGYAMAAALLLKEVATLPVPASLLAYCHALPASACASSRSCSPTQMRHVHSVSRSVPANGAFLSLAEDVNCCFIWYIS